MPSHPLLVGTKAVRDEIGIATLCAAGANVGSFVLGLLALRRGAAAPVLAVRSSSIVIATLLAGRFLAERVSPMRLAGSGLVFGGVVLLALNQIRTGRGTAPPAGARAGRREDRRR